MSVGEEVIASVGEVVVGFRVHPAAALVLNRVVFLQVMISTSLMLMKNNNSILIDDGESH